MATEGERQFIALVQYESDGKIYEPGEVVTLPYITDWHKDLVGMLVRTKVLEPRGKTPVEKREQTSRVKRGRR